ncbi:dienelactone hydrolase family protein [Zavarzinia compransoris]|uniref:dienelactone hydrolase family protein n=1 Tax=Zavarzinia marina TaxID=2911065 RepID=UPI001F2B3B47|nr:dienelactone hydrolase family protein [Zavarzinia marina]MCF4164679.1 dienelactone hydrolase family protein [Zavarzinia marina]
MSGGWIELEASDGHRFQAWHVAPEGERRATLVIAMEIFGVNGHIRAVAEGFAEAGFEVLAPQLYDRAERGIDLPYDAEGIARGRELAMKIGMDGPMLDVAACVAHLRRDDTEKKPVGIVGYCYGGAVAWAAADRVAGLGCAVGYYGTAILQFMGAEPKCPTMLHFGAKDASIPLDKVEQLAGRHPEVAIHVYDADHGFNSDRRANYDEAAASLARERTLDFLFAHLT